MHSTLDTSLLPVYMPKFLDGFRLILSAFDPNFVVSFDIRLLTLKGIPHCQDIIVKFLDKFSIGSFPGSLQSTTNIIVGIHLELNPRRIKLPLFVKFHIEELVAFLHGLFIRYAVLVEFRCEIFKIFLLLSKSKG